MKLMPKILLAAVVFPLVISTNALAYGGKDHHGKGGECRPGLDREIMKELKLTDQQKSELKSLRQADKEEMKARFKDNKEQGENARLAHIEKLNSLLMADKFDPAKATQLANEMSEKQVERQVDRLSKQHKMLSILTTEQKAQFIELQKERQQDCLEDMSRHHGKDRK